MTLTITLTPAEEARLFTMVQQVGLAPDALAHQILVKQLDCMAPRPTEDPTLALFAQWDAEDAQMTAEELAEAQQAYTTFTQNMNAERERLGARRLYP
ncbi:hypothetical protein [Candidatus Entotheonella palauensis]|uniref:hypothetical protein n=1 Tax=Candidatus Entotheonella palauensis TaxID=93172 RepID=UPI000B7F1FED|nr:hypothetical protein [Candidatus Entotheonella palauensis]